MSWLAAALLLHLCVCAAAVTRPPSSASLSTAIRAGQYRRAVTLFEDWARAAEQEPTPATAGVFTEAMAAYGRLGRGEEALDLFQRMQASGLRPNLRAYTAAARACASSRLWPVALSLYADVHDSDELTSDTVFVNAVLKACERGGQHEEAELLLGEMRANGPPPDAISYNTVIAAASRCGKWQRALALLDDMEKARGDGGDGGGGGGDGGGGGVAANAVAPDGAIVAGAGGAVAVDAAAAEDGRDASTSVRRGTGRSDPSVLQPDVFSYAAAISACERGGRADLALSTFQRMQLAGVRPNAVVYNTAIRACATEELWPAALSLLDDMREDGVAPTLVTYNAALTACERGGEWREAQLLLQELEEEPVGLRGGGGAERPPLAPDEITYHTAIACAVRAGGGKGAARFAVRLLTSMMGRGLRPNVIAFTGAMKACNAAAAWRAALAVYERMEGAGVRIDGIATHEALRAAASLGDWRAAMRMLPRSASDEEGLREVLGAAEAEAEAEAAAAEAAAAAAAAAPSDGGRGAERGRPLSEAAAARPQRGTGRRKVPSGGSSGSGSIGSGSSGSGGSSGGRPAPQGRRGGGRGGGRARARGGGVHSRGRGRGAPSHTPLRAGSSGGGGTSLNRPEGVAASASWLLAAKAARAGGQEALAATLEEAAATRQERERRRAAK